ncbi:MAG TPA: haloalkane dehalogenase [Mycobacteriales bacterium]|jgi:haloalkane dehalogenase|nr:haloalkane dehalogenase [Mycobacteriales bacterium]
MQILRTPDERFADLPDFPWEPRYVDVDGLRIAYVEAGPADGPVVLCLHGEPTWSFLYRKVLRVLADRGCRAVAVDLVGFGRSDKPAHVADYTYARHVEWIRAAVFDRLDLRDVTLLGQDWGGLVGLRLVAENPDRFARVVAANTGLPDGRHEMPEVWWMFRRAVESAERLDIGRFVASGCESGLTPQEQAAYDAPFPDESFKAGPRSFPGLVPTTPDDPGAVANQKAWEVLLSLDLPFLCAFSDGDPITAPMGPLLARVMPGAAGRDHPTIRDAGHFLQEDAGAELGRVVADFVAST